MSDRRLPRPLIVEPLYPSNGLPPRPGEDRPALSPFGRLAMGQLLGKSSILIYDNRADVVQEAPVNIVAIEGDDLDAQQLILTLHPPRVIPLSFVEISGRLDQQNLTGEQTSAEVTAGNFPGTSEPIRWPPLEAFVEFGTGGVNTKIAVDYMNGVTLSVSASFLRVTAAVTQGRGSGDFFGTSAAYYLAAHAGPGFAESHAQRTIFVGDVSANDESLPQDVPRYSKVATLVGYHRHHRAPTRMCGWIRFWQSPDGTNGAGDFFVSDNGARVEVPNGAPYFTVLNESKHASKMSVLFELAL